jgi:hypothetical protein
MTAHRRQAVVSDAPAHAEPMPESRRGKLEREHVEVREDYQQQARIGGTMQELEIAFNARRELWSFVQLKAVLQAMDERWPATPGPAALGWAQHRYVFSRQRGDEDALRFVLRREQPIAEAEASAALRELEVLAQTHFPSGSRLWHTTQSIS